MEGQAEASEVGTYVHGYNAEHREFLSVRTAARQADFFLPYLKEGMRLLDCGCGQGAITTGLAAAILPGEAVGIDMGESQIAAAREWAAAKGQQNVRFEVGNLYEIPFPDASFDAVFANTVLEHVDDPGRAMREMRRVLKPGGVVGLADPDYGTLIQEPSTPLSLELRELLLRFSKESGSPFYARNMRRTLLDSGFVRPVSFVQAYGTHTVEDNRFAIEKVQIPSLEALRPRIVQRGLADAARIDAMIADARAWSERPDGFYALMHCAAVAWAP
ncbi:MAG: methyltransferase domain-containing protein [Deltaproteobacteria bacterium]|nr:methyltransferase domain-containing protein [Deltaproteobacteria bacterium]